MIVNSMRFGEIEIEDKKIIQFPQGIPGLEDIKRFALVYNEETKPISWLQAIDSPAISLPVIDPFLILPNYVFDILQEDINDLSIAHESDIHVVNVLVIPEDMEKMTINLAAPILINIKLNLGKQIFIDGKDYLVRKPVFELIRSCLKGVHAGACVDEKSE